ncbi:thioredoxin family protein [Candidatus Bipolaricaulota bacterium]
MSIALSGSASAWLRVTNISVYEADDIEVALLDGPVELVPVEPVKVLDPFSDVQMEVSLLLGDAVAEGEHETLLELAYTYCIGEVCFQIIEEIPLRIEVIPAAVEPINGQIQDPVQNPVRNSPPQDPSIWKIMIPIALGLALITALITSRILGRRWWVQALLLAVLASGLGFGLSLEQDQQAQSIGAVLCTSCVGIEETPNRDPELSPQARIRVAALTQEVELVFFTAPWCQACPYAKAMLQQMVDINPLISYRLIDVDEERDAADRHGIVISGRTILPAILRVDTGVVLFGIEDLEDRLIAQLEESL